MVRPHLECVLGAQLWTHQYKREIELLEEAQQKATNIVKGLEHLSCEKRCRVGTVQPGEEKSQGYLINVCKYLMGGIKDDKSSLFSGVPVTGQKTMGTN